MSQGQRIERVRMMTLSNKSHLFVYPMIFIFGVILLFLRNPDPVLNPAVYAEDGIWTALALRDGWISAFLFSRTDYFVFFSTILLFISWLIAMVIGGGIESLPFAIAFVSFSFFSLFSLIVFITVKHVSSSFFAVLALILTLLIPLGDTQNEIIGRILQVGFYMPALAVMLFFWREKHPQSARRCLIDLMLFIAAGTNPVVFVLSFFYFLYLFVLNNFSIRSTLKNNALFISLFSFLAFFISLRISGQSAAIPEQFIASNLLETVIARPILYPLLFPWYNELSDEIVLSFFAALCTFIFFALKASDNPEAKKLIYAVIVTIISYTTLTISMRIGLTAFFNSYQTTILDRYFMGINVLVPILIVLALAQLPSNRTKKSCSYIFGLSFVLIYVVNYTLIFEWGKSKMPMGFLTFQDQICLSEASSGLGEIQIYPLNWKMSIPEKYINKSDCDFDYYKTLGIAQPGANYKVTPSEALSLTRTLTINFYGPSKNKKLNRLEIMFGTYMRINSGNAELVLRSAAGQHVHIEFPLAELVDNRYKIFDLPDNFYVSGEVVSLTGEGISAWESHNEGGRAYTCMNFVFSDGTRGFTPGCPIF